MIKPIYLDYNATTPIDSRVVEAMLPYLYQHFGNPSSSHVYGQKTHQAIQHARQQVADLLGCQPEEIIFTSGGSESNNHAIQGMTHIHDSQGSHIITSATEHPAVTEVCKWLQQQGFSITYLPVDRDGRVDPADVEKSITPKTFLVTIMHANNEVGTVQPIAEISRITRRHGVFLHSDCAQSVGKIPVKVDELGVDLLTVAGHKLYAPKGVGVLYVRQRVPLSRFIHGASHEQNRRAGTENVASIVGLGEACRLLQEESQEQVRLAQLRDRLETALQQAFPQIRINGANAQRLPNTASIGFPGLRAPDILRAMQTEVVASAGAACHSDGVSVSHVLQAMQVPVVEATGTLRFSVGRMTTSAEMDHAILAIQQAVQSLYRGHIIP